MFSYYIWKFEYTCFCAIVKVRGKITQIRQTKKKVNRHLGGGNLGEIIEIVILFLSSIKIWK